MTHTPMPRIHRCTHRTKNCIYCGDPAEIWSGWVRLGHEAVIAGYCKRCFKSMTIVGYHGKYEPKMGRII